MRISEIIPIMTVPVMARLFFIEFKRRASMLFEAVGDPPKGLALGEYGTRVDSPIFFNS